MVDKILSVFALSIAFSGLFFFMGQLPCPGQVSSVQLKKSAKNHNVQIESLPVKQWVKLSPLPSLPPSPTLGYEGACVWDAKHDRLIRYGGHNQGGGGEQNSEIWSFNPENARWDFHQPNLRPPGICCGQQNIFASSTGKYIRFPAFSHSHGWQWYREVYLNNSSVWSFGLDQNRWREMRPVPSPHPRPLRCSSWDTDYQVSVLFGGEGSYEGTLVYDPSRNYWVKMKPPTEPMFRSGGNMAYDSQHKLHILFGTQFKDDPHTWAYNLKTNRWIDMKPKVMPPTKKNGAVLAYDSINKVIIAIVRSKPKDIKKEDQDDSTSDLETWSYDVGKNEWKQLSHQHQPDPSPDRARQLTFSPKHNLFLLENRTNGKKGKLGEQQIWGYRYAKKRIVKELPSPPKQLSVTTASDSVTLCWKPSSDTQKKNRKYRIYRGTGKNSWDVKFEQQADVDGAIFSWVDKSVIPKTTYYYRVATIVESQESRPSVLVKTQPSIIDDLVVSVLAVDRVSLKWALVSDSDVAGYIVERAIVDVYSEDQLKHLKLRTAPLNKPSVGAIKSYGVFHRMTSQLIAGDQWVDAKVDLSIVTPITGKPIHDQQVHHRHVDMKGKPYRFGVFAYRVRAVNQLGCLGGASPAVLTIPSPVQDLFSKDGQSVCQLKWKASQEKGLQGYRVYRLDGRWETPNSVSRLTPKTISKRRYEDSSAGSKTRRYHVLAVDAIGQEGHPSPPVWYRRRWKSFYTPFTDEWHQ